MKRNSQQGVALVITLILLSVITFLAVTFLVVSRHEGAQVSTVVQQSNAKFAADAALEQAKAQILAQMIGTGNGLNFGMMVSTNLISTNNYLTGNASLTNVSYNGITTAGDLEAMLNNLLILPRPPVFIFPNRNQTTGGDFRFWLDLNRNGKYDTNGSVQELFPDGSAKTDSSGHNIFTNYIGDPEWVGVLNQPEYRHSSSNFFVGRYAFIALPIGNSLDVNYAHNEAMKISGGTTMPVNNDDGYLRNQGVGTWELNLAGFLNILSTNIWPDYHYNTPVAPSFSVNVGESFYDAAALLQYRYNNFYNNVSNYNNVFPNGLNYLVNGYVDAFSAAPAQIMTNIFPSAFYGYQTTLAANVTDPWPGADNPNAFFDTQDFFNGSTAMSGFTNRLIQAGLSKGTDERYTFYRMLSQMSFGSAPEPAPYPYTNKINLNYNNIGTNSVSGFKAFSRTTSTNFVSWVNNPVQFFTNAADRMLRQTFPNMVGVGYSNGLVWTTNWAQLSITNIPLYPANFYTPAVHRILQEAANIFDATTSRSTNGFFYPSVFRPTFNRTGASNVFISGYVEDVETTTPSTDASHFYNILPASLPEDAGLIGPATVNVYNVPWIIGAKKGFPNFNEFAMNTVAQISRKVQIVKPSLEAVTAGCITNIQYIVGISNVLGLEAWNSYQSAYPRSISIIGADYLSVNLTNELGVLVSSNMAPSYPSPGLFYSLLQYSPVTGGQPVVIPAGGWSAYNFTLARNNPAYANASFQIPLFTNVILLSNMVYHPKQSPIFNTNTIFDNNLGPIQPQFGINVTNRVRFVMADTVTGRVIDFVQFGMNFQTNLLSAMSATNNDDGGPWDTNRYSYPNGPIVGVANQIQISLGVVNIPGYLPFTQADWQNDRITPTSQFSGVGAFSNFFYGYDLTNLSMQVPYTPTRLMSFYNTWQANDPLVHYTLSDLSFLPRTLSTSTSYLFVAANSNAPPLPNIGTINLHYSPWLRAGNPKSQDTNTSNLAVKDPMVEFSDAWQFPTNGFPNVGWLGRVHRGTPWQTVYLKSPYAETNGWINWTGDTNFFYMTNNGVPVPFADAYFSLPYNDWNMMDLFTTSPNDNASRGQLSVNQSGYAAWAAVLSGVPVITNTPSGQQTSTNIDPNQTYLGTNTIQYLVNYINATRASLPGGVFTSAGQLAMVPQLSIASPYLAGSTVTPSDDIYERIPQQIMSLVRLGSPRYVIFSYGQSLKPADHSLVQSGQYFGMCTNYQITGEVVTRTVLRVDNFPVPGQPPTQPRVVVESFNVLPPE